MVEVDPKGFFSSFLVSTDGIHDFHVFDYLWLLLCPCLQKKSLDYQEKDAKN
jgi:hypothetical protein